MGSKGYRPPSVPYVGIGARIDDLQFDRNVSCLDMSESIGIDRKVLYGIKNGNNCSINSIVKIANYFNVSIDWLVFGKEKHGKAFNTGRNQ